MRDRRGRLPEAVVAASEERQPASEAQEEQVCMGEHYAKECWFLSDYIKMINMITKNNLKSI